MQQRFLKSFLLVDSDTVDAVDIFHFLFNAYFLVSAPSVRLDSGRANADRLIKEVKRYKQVAAFFSSFSFISTFLFGLIVNGLFFCLRLRLNKMTKKEGPASQSFTLDSPRPFSCQPLPLKVHKREKFFRSDFELFTILQLVKLKYLGFVKKNF